MSSRTDTPTGHFSLITLPFTLSAPRDRCKTASINNSNTISTAPTQTKANKTAVFGHRAVREEDSKTAVWTNTSVMWRNHGALSDGKLRTEHAVQIWTCLTALFIANIGSNLLLPLLQCQQCLTMSTKCSNRNSWGRFLHLIGPC